MGSLSSTSHMGTGRCSAHNGFLSQQKNLKFRKPSSFKKHSSPQLTLPTEADIMFTILVSKQNCLLPMERCYLHFPRPFAIQTPLENIKENKSCPKTYGNITDNFPQYEFIFPSYLYIISSGQPSSEW